MSKPSAELDHLRCLQELTAAIAAADNNLASPEFLTGIYKMLNRLTVSSQLDISLLPMLRIDDHYTFQDPRSVAEQGVGERQNLVDFLTNTYRLKPEVILLDPIPDELSEKYPYLHGLRACDRNYFALIPILYSNDLIGVVELLPQPGKSLTMRSIDALSPAMPALNLYFQKSRQAFDKMIEQYLKDNCTVLQPAVQWRFNQAARQAICLSPEQAVKEIEGIKFEKVHPVYGAIDIKNSTINRNAALKKDLGVQLGLLIALLVKLDEASKLDLIREKISICQNWLLKIAQSEIFEDSEISYYLEADIHVFLKEFDHSRDGWSAEISNYFNSLDERHGETYACRRVLEDSMNKMIHTINAQVAALDREVQQHFPCYFEKFQTDGVEYDFYIGQSISPYNPFFQYHLQNVRLLQLANMISVVKAAHDLRSSLTTTVEITQLIFIQPHCIDIKFRVDERRFDVEGAYNIRYHIVKKRIDKVHINGTNERLTMPGKIAIVYISPKDAEEMIGHIRFLQKKGLLHDDLEILDLEPLQGLSGLKALRIGVNLKEGSTP